MLSKDRFMQQQQQQQAHTNKFSSKNYKSLDQLNYTRHHKQQQQQNANNANITTNNNSNNNNNNHRHYTKPTNILNNINNNSIRIFMKLFSNNNSNHTTTTTTTSTASTDTKCKYINGGDTLASDNNNDENILLNCFPLNSHSNNNKHEQQNNNYYNIKEQNSFEFQENKYINNSKSRFNTFYYPKTKITSIINNLNTQQYKNDQKFQPQQQQKRFYGDLISKDEQPTTTYTNLDYIFGQSVTNKTTCFNNNNNNKSSNKVLEEDTSIHKISSSGSNNTHSYLSNISLNTSNKKNNCNKIICNNNKTNNNNKQPLKTTISFKEFRNFEQLFEQFEATNNTSNNSNCNNTNKQEQEQEYESIDNLDQDYYEELGEEEVEEAEEEDDFLFTNKIKKTFSNYDYNNNNNSKIVNYENMGQKVGKCDEHKQNDKFSLLKYSLSFPIGFGNTATTTTTTTTHTANNSSNNNNNNNNATTNTKSTNNNCNNDVNLVVSSDDVFNTNNQQSAAVLTSNSLNNISSFDITNNPLKEQYDEIKSRSRKETLDLLLKSIQSIPPSSKFINLQQNFQPIDCNENERFDNQQLITNISSSTTNDNLNYNTTTTTTTNNNNSNEKQQQQQLQINNIKPTSNCNSNNKNLHEKLSIVNNENTILNEFEKLTKECFKQQSKDNCLCNTNTNNNNNKENHPTNNNNNNNNQNNYHNNNNNSNNSNNNKIIGRAIVIKEYTPSPYDNSSLCIKNGDLIDIIDMNDTGIWTGILNNKIGTFKFINVNLIETNITRNSSEIEDKLRNSLTNYFPIETITTTTTTTTSTPLSSTTTTSLETQQTIDSVDYFDSKLINKINQSNIHENTLIDELLSKINCLKGYIDVLYKHNINTCKTFSILINENYLRNQLKINNSNHIEQLVCIQSTIKQRLDELESNNNNNKKLQQQQQNISNNNTTNSRPTELALSIESNSNSIISNNQILNNVHNCNSTTVKYRKMGQKQMKTSSNDIMTSTINKNNTNSSSSRNNSSSNTHTQSRSGSVDNRVFMKKSNHDSALSNDSGCYSNTDSSGDRNSSPSGSSVLCIFDNQHQIKQQTILANTTNKNTLTVKNNNEICRNKFSTNTLPLTKCSTVDTRRTRFSESSANNRRCSIDDDNIFYEDEENNNVRLNNSLSQSTTSLAANSPPLKQKFKTNRSKRKTTKASINGTDTINTMTSAATTLNTSSHYSSLSSLSINITNLNDETYFDTDYLNSKAQLLCEQINQILTMTTSMVDSRINQSSIRNHHFINQSNKSKKNKTLATLNKNNKQVQIKSDGNDQQQQQQQQQQPRTYFSFSNKTNKNLIRSHTFNENYSNRIYINNTDDEDAANKANNKHTKKMAKYLFKNGRKLFVWKTKNQRNNNQPAYIDDQQLLNNNKLNKLNNNTVNQQHIKQLNVIENRNNFVLSLIAAKLLSENIELAKYPYTDECGFCKIPPALIRRYSYELKQPLEIIAQCLEIERISQLENGCQVAIPNDFLIDSCKCLLEYKYEDNEQYKFKKCDLNTKDIDSFFISLGLPMYIEKFQLIYKKTIIDNQQQLEEENFEKLLCEINVTDYFQTHIQSYSQAHLNVILNAIADLKHR